MQWSRKRFLAAATIVAILPLMGFVKRGITVTYVPNHFPAQPDGKALGPVHGGVAVDRAGNVYVSTDTSRGIVVFGSDGKFQRNFGPGQIHGLYIVREKDGEFLYCARPGDHEVLKLKTDGTEMWKMGYPEESGIYKNAGEYNPTNMVALQDGTIFVADGYGKNYIHKYDKNRKYIKSFGGPGGVPAEDGKFNRCHGLTVDSRGPKPLLMVCNRESGKVEQWDTDGNLVQVLQRNLRMPACVNVYGDLVAIGELQGRVTILGKDNSIVATVGDNPKENQRANFGLNPSDWTEGISNSPHGISFDRSGNLIVSEWSQFGRLHYWKIKK